VEQSFCPSAPHLFPLPEPGHQMARAALNKILKKSFKKSVLALDDAIKL
jgi:hypothetical protein